MPLQYHKAVAAIPIGCTKPYWPTAKAAIQSGLRDLPVHWLRDWNYHPVDFVEPCSGSSMFNVEVLQHGHSNGSSVAAWCSLQEKKSVSCLSGGRTHRFQAGCCKRIVKHFKCIGMNKRLLWYCLFNITCIVLMFWYLYWPDPRLHGLLLLVALIILYPPPIMFCLWSLIAPS